MKECRPDPTNLQKTLEYLTYQASLGRFKRKPSAFKILSYLALNSWRRVPNQENEPIGTVLSGKVKAKHIAAGTALSMRTVRRHLEWLENNNWITIYAGRGADGRFDQHTIITRLDQRSHELREQALTSGQNDHRLRAKMSTGPVDKMTTLYKGSFTRDFNSVVAEQVQVPTAAKEWTFR
jgi:DNA-binding transcriptional ArsR family regulator